MLDEVVKEIKTAEEECLKMQSDAENKARKHLRDADSECEEIVKKTAFKIKTMLAEERTAAELAAQEKYNERIKAYEAEAEALKKSKAEVVDEAAAEVVNMILSKYVNR